MANFGIGTLGESESCAVRILLVEDEPEMADALATALKGHDMVVDCAATLAEADEMIAVAAHDAILLDRGLPDGDGITLISALRGRQVQTPIIILTAKDDLTHRVEGLDIGADDYLAKPFAMDELMARLRAVLRRPTHVRSDVIRLGRLAFDLEHREASIGGVRFDLPRRELIVLETLIRRSGRTVLRIVLEGAVYALGDAVQSNALDTHVSRLRRKLAEADAGVEIHGIRGVGYLMRLAA
jgi:DNA-binding response OmpR family regulator